jgi:hypothetical protein
LSNKTLEVGIGIQHIFGLNSQTQPSTRLQATSER